MDIGISKPETDLSTILRREFFARAAFLATGAATIASAHDSEVPRWQGFFDRSMAVYGNLTFNELFTSDVHGTIYNKLKAYVTLALSLGQLKQAEADKINEALDAIKNAPTLAGRTFTDFYTGKIVYPTGLLKKLKYIDDNIIWLTFCTQPAHRIPYAAEALDPAGDSLTNPQVCGATKVIDFYEKTAVQLSHASPHIMAIGKGKMGYIFGMHYSQDNFASDLEIEQAMAALSGPIKANNLRCTDPACTSGSCCTPCTGCFCTQASGGGCSAMSDTGPCVVL